MMKYDTAEPIRYDDIIRESRLSIYDSVEKDNQELWIPTPDLEKLLNTALKGISLSGLKLRTRSKVVKEHICRALGYPVPTRFKKTQPRFPGQFFDTYVQKSNNLQIWNEELSPTRRYVIIRLNEADVIMRVKVVTGDILAMLDTTGTLTQKYQARLSLGSSKLELISLEDTEHVQPCVEQDIDLSSIKSPICNPIAGQLLPIQEVFQRLLVVVNKSFPDSGHDQERNRGAALHRLVCQSLGYAGYQDDGQFPDVRHQLLEVKLQTSPTIDLGLIRPDSTETLDIPRMGGRKIRHCDVRYALFYATTNGDSVTLTHLFLTTGEKFFTRFPQFQGNVLNKKLQIPLPGSFFDE